MCNAAAIWRQPCLALFGDEPTMLAAGTAYLHSVGPAYGPFRLGFALYFASPGDGRLVWPLPAGVAGPPPPRVSARPFFPPGGAPGGCSGRCSPVSPAC